ncbi:AAA family ATPase [Micromonospora sp. C81]|uniref:AAA family ATPase n=1 Tax=Micromonospora sp. C81 TaxID=2824881 RepID=UPI001B397349|nr:AAA family ATPase [Micromonospora sp. C81]MBQ1039298.1 AAA family ATPase [Micromonospora sp. C81]
MTDTEKGPGQGAPNSSDGTNPTGLDLVKALHGLGAEVRNLRNPDDEPMYATNCPLPHKSQTSWYLDSDRCSARDHAKTAMLNRFRDLKRKRNEEAKAKASTPPPQAEATEAEAAAATEAAVLALMAELLDSDGLDQIPDPEPLIEGLLDLDTLAWIIGRSGNGKTFVTIDICGSVTTGTPWHGHKSVQGKVVYIAAEGARGFKKRIRAWEKHHNLKMGANLLVLPRPVLINEAEWGALVEACRRIGPVLIVLDTMARVSAGMEENSSKDMGILVHQAERLREACGACVSLVHHQGHKGENGRGSSALIGAMNTEIRVSMDKKTRIVTVENSKQKDEAEGEDLRFLLAPVDLGTDARGKPLGSAVLTETTVAATVDPDKEDVTENQAKIIGIMQDYFSAGGTKSEIKARCLKKAGMTDSSWYYAWNQMVEATMVQADGAKFTYIPLSQRI